MKRLLFLSLAASAMSGCASVRTPLAFPPTRSETYEYVSQDKVVTVKAHVSGETCIGEVLVVFGFGTSSVALAYRDALAKAPGAEALMDIRVDRRKSGVFPFFIKNCRIVSGRAVRFQGAPRKKGRESMPR